MRRVLIVAYYFPPLGGMGSLRLAGFARHLPAHGWEPVVVTPRHGAYHRDPDLDVTGVQVVRTASIEISRAAKRVLRTGGDDVAPAPVGGVRALMRRTARRVIYFPDSQVGWYLPALRAARRAMKDQPVDAILSSSFPVTAHLVARRLASDTGVGWVADWRDPWTEMSPGGAAEAPRASRLERSLAGAASARVMTSPSWARHHEKVWQAPVTTIPNGHDLDREAPDRHDQFVLTYMGSFYPDTQDLSAAWRAVRRLDGRPGNGVDHVRFIGELHPALRQQLSDQGLAGRVQVTGFVGHREAMKQLLSSSALLVAGPRDARGILRGQIAGKIPEYLATGLPVVYVGDPDCDAAELLRAYPGCHVAAPGDVDAVAEALERSHGSHHERDVSGLSRNALTGRLAAVLDDVVR